MHIQELACCWLDEGLAASLVAGSASQRAWTKEAKLLHSAALPLKCVLSILEGSGFQQWAESTRLWDTSICSALPIAQTSEPINIAPLIRDQLMRLYKTRCT